MLGVVRVPCSPLCLHQIPPGLDNVQHVNRLGASREINHPELSRVLMDANFANPCTYRWHRLPVMRILPSLNALELIPSVMPSLLCKSRTIGVAHTHPIDRLENRIC